MFLLLLEKTSLARRWAMLRCLLACIACIVVLPAHARASEEAGALDAGDDAADAGELAASPPQPAALDAGDDGEDEASSDAIPAPAPTLQAKANGVPPADMAPGEVRVRDRVVVVLRVARDGLSPQARARAATQRIAALLTNVADAGAVHAETLAGRSEATIFVGTTPVLVVGVEDSDAAMEPSVESFAEVSANSIAEAFAAERTRSAVATTVFRLSLLVFTGLVLFLLLSRLGAIATRLRQRFAADDHPVHDLSVGKLQVLSAGSVRVLLSAGITFGYRMLQLLLGFGYLLFGLSLFERTRPWTEQLTGVVVTPFSSIATRLAGGMPMLVVASIGLFAVSVLLRFTGLFFDSVGRGETRVEWLPRDLAKPTSLLVRSGIVLASLVLIAPLLTGDDQGVAAHAATVVLAMIGLAMLPNLTSAAIGAPLVFARRLRKNEHVELGRYRGRVREVGLLDLRLEDEQGAEVRVPHLYAFFHPLRILGGAPTISVDILVAADSDLGDVESKLLAAARKLTARADVRLISLDAGGARYRITSVAKAVDRGTLSAALASTLKDSGIVLGAGSR